MLRLHAVGDWGPGQVLVTQRPGTRRIVAEVERLIDESWESMLRRPGVRLFDGAMCRMESWEASPQALRLMLSQTSYKPFVGTNLMHPELAERYGPEVMADPVGISPALATCDDYLLLGRRNESVAYYPSRLHPFAGSMEPRDDGDVFAAARRELGEELGLQEADILEIRCTGLVEDSALLQPELIFAVRTRLTRVQVEAQVDPQEHGGSVAIAAKPDEIAQALVDPALTPIAAASLLLWGRTHLGESWFENAGRISVRT